jgi:hypothetical protein
MSYDVQIGNWSGNMTSNCVLMWDSAMPGMNLRDMNGVEGRICLIHLTEGVLRMLTHEEDYRAIAPSNGWGSYEGGLRFLQEIAVACAAHPEEELFVQR